MTPGGSEAAEISIFRGIGSQVTGGVDDPLVVDSVPHAPLNPRFLPNPPKQYLFCSKDEDNDRDTDGAEVVEHKRGSDEKIDGRGRASRGETEKRSTSSASDVVSCALDRTMDRIAVSPKASKRFRAIAKERDMAEAAAGFYIRTVSKDQILSQDAASSICAVLDITPAKATSPPRKYTDLSSSSSDSESV